MRTLTVVLVGVALGSVVAASGATGDVAGLALRIAKKARAQSTADHKALSKLRAQSAADHKALGRVEAAIVAGPKVDRSVVTYGVGPGAEIIGTPGCTAPGLESAYPLAGSVDADPGLEVVSESATPQGFRLDLRNPTDRPLTARFTHDCLYAAEAGGDSTAAGRDPYPFERRSSRRTATSPQMKARRYTVRSPHRAG